MQTLITQSAQIAEAIAGVQPLYWLGAAVSEGNTVFLVGVLAIIGAVFLLVYAFLSATFLTTATTKRGVVKVKYQHRSLRLSSPKTALLRKELARLFSSTVYLLNACLGVLFLLVGSVVLVIKRDMIGELLARFPGLEQYPGAVLVTAICCLLLMCVISAPSVSLEGKSIWIPKSVPVMPITVLMAKVKLHMVMTIPASVIASTAVALTVKLTPLMLVLVYLLPVTFTSFMAFLGVVVNVRFPRLDWQSEAQVVKQGVSVSVCLFGGMFLLALVVALYAVVLRDVLPVELYMLCITVIFAALSLILYAYLLGSGARRFEELS